MMKTWAKLIIYYQILSPPHVACYALCIKFAQSLVFGLKEKILSTDTGIILFCLMAVVAAKNPPFKGVFLSPFVTVQTPFDISMCVFINYRSKMYLDPWKRFKGEICEMLLVAYHNLSHKGKLTS